jgi:hypothetical protein
MGLFNERFEISLAKKQIKGIGKKEDKTAKRGAVCPHDWYPGDARVNLDTLSRKDITTLAFLAIM